MSQELPEEDMASNEEIPPSTQSSRSIHGSTETEQSDGRWQAELVARCLMGDESAFVMIVDQYGNLLLRTAYLLVQDEEAAKDILQDSLLLAWKNMSKLREPAFLRAWLLKIVVNQSISLKRQWARKAALLREQFTQTSIEDSIQIADFARGRTEDRLDVEQAIAQLPLNQRVVLVLFYYHRMTMPEIATMLGVAENTLRKRLQAALAKTRRALQLELAGTPNTALTHEGVNTRISMHRGGA